MVDLVIICRDGLVNSYISSLVAAMESKKAGGDVAVVFTQEALYALAEKKFRFSKSLEGMSDKIKDNAKKAGLSADPLDLVKAAKDAGVKMLACPAWSDLLEVRGKLPEELEIPELPELLGIIAGAKQIIGTF
jgi:peroxiredoxin family protein